MFEKVNPAHPDKIADRIAGALVDYAYSKEADPKIAVEVLIGHGVCHIIAETTVSLPKRVVKGIVYRIAGKIKVELICVPQDAHLYAAQCLWPVCGDNGIFKAVPVNDEEEQLTQIAKALYNEFPSDGKYLVGTEPFLNNYIKYLYICQSNATDQAINKCLKTKTYLGKDTSLVTAINPLGYWTGGTNVDTGCTNRKLGSDLGRSITGGGIHGKDLSKADVTATIYCALEAERTKQEIEAFCRIGDSFVTVNYSSSTCKKVKFADMICEAKKYIDEIGGFEKLAEWGLIR